MRCSNMENCTDGKKQARPIVLLGLAYVTFFQNSVFNIIALRLLKALFLPSGHIYLPGLIHR